MCLEEQEEVCIYQLVQQPSVAVITNDHILGGLKQHKLIILWFSRSEVWFLCPWSHKTEIKLLAWWKLSGRICFQTHSGCWQNSFSCGHRSEVSFLAGCQLVASQSSFWPPASLVILPFFLSQGYESSPSHVLNFSDFLFCISSVSSLRKSSVFKSSCDWIEPTRTIQDNLPVFRSVALIMYAKPFCHIPYDMSQISGVDNFGRHYAAYHCWGTEISEMSDIMKEAFQEDFSAVRQRIDRARETVRRCYSSRRRRHESMDEGNGNTQ